MIGPNAKHLIKVLELTVNGDESLEYIAEMRCIIQTANALVKELFSKLSPIYGLPPIVVPKRELGNADFRHENLCYCLAVS